MPAARDATEASLEGRVHDVRGGPVKDAQIAIRSRETGALRARRPTDAENYRLFGMSPGSYDVVVRAIGFRPQRRDSVELVVDEPRRVDFSLSLDTGVVALDPMVASANTNGAP